MYILISGGLYLGNLHIEKSTTIRMEQVHLNERVGGGWCEIVPQETLMKLKELLILLSLR